jgi:conjugal transfer pilus assembly protein TrbC
MKSALYKLLLISGLLSCAPAIQASGQTPVSSQDMTWMKEQQSSLQAFQDAMRNQSVQLPASQQDLVTRLQQNIGEQQMQQGSGQKKSFPAIYFVSLGLPREGLLPMLQDANRYGIPATLRGLVNNDMRRTAALMFELSKEDKKIGVQIDPTLYSDYGVTVVPALVVTCPGHFDIIRGSLPLKAALEKVVERGECAATARQLLEGAQ